MFQINIDDKSIVQILLTRILFKFGQEYCPHFGVRYENFEYRMYQAKSPPPLAKFFRKKGGGLSARQVTSVKFCKKPAKIVTFSRNVAKIARKSGYKRGGDLARDR